MKKLSLILVIAGLTFFAYNAYGSQPAKAVAENAAPVFVPGKKNVSNNAKGEQIYNQVCFKCHQLNGMGIPGVFPPLTGSDFLKTATKKRLLEQVLNGSNETLTVNGMQYSTPMPPQVKTTDDAIAVIDYVLNAWGNNYGHATAADAKGLQSK
ncbi:MAG: cytochrome c [Bacteroidales bacterium]|nr:cytochrome c [Bacteroidales bacterium]